MCKSKLISLILILIVICLFTSCYKSTFNSNENEPIKINPSVAENILPTTTEDKKSVLKVHYIDVGQADAALIVCNGKSMLIDGGNPDDSIHLVQTAHP